MRQVIKDQEVGLDPYFRYRGMNQTRIETFSDTAFALAITLLVLSSTVPETYSQLMSSLRSVVPFGLCIILVALIWYQHYIFFLRYGLQNTFIVVLNVILLFLILVYVYPLKFLFRYLFELSLAGVSGDWGVVQGEFGELTLGSGAMQVLMVVYGLGATAIFFTLAWMYRYALKKKIDLDLNDYEVLVTQSSLWINLLQGAIPALSVLVAATSLFGKQYSPMIAGFVYWLYPIILPIAGRRFGRQRAQYLEDSEEDLGKTL
ncbi:MAG: TMEM175 family protein [Bacteroidota bacterium]